MEKVAIASIGNGVHTVAYGGNCSAVVHFQVLEFHVLCLTHLSSRYAVCEVPSKMFGIVSKCKDTGSQASQFMDLNFEIPVLLCTKLGVFSFVAKQSISTACTDTAFQTLLRV